MSVRVLVADDQTLVRAGFRGIIDVAPGFTVVGEAGTGPAAVESARRERPDVVLMDIRMPGMDGLEATRLITGAGGSPGVPGVRVLILTMFDLDEHIYAALRGGAGGFLLKDTAPEDLLDAIRVVAAGEALLAPSVTRRLIAEFARRPDAPGVRAVATPVPESPPVAPMSRSPGPCTSPRAPPRHTWATCSPNSARATACTW